MVGNYGTDIGFWPEDAIALAGDMVAEFAGREYYYGCGLRGTPLEFAKLYLQLAIKHKDEDGVAVQKRIIEIIELSL